MASRSHAAPGEIQTVLGSVPARDAGVVLPHEHIFIDLAPWAPAHVSSEQDDLWEAPVTIENLGRIRHGTWSNRANMVLDDAATAVAEVARFGAAGGGTIVDVTPRYGLGRDVERLRKVSEETGVAVVCGTSYYVVAAHPPTVQTQTEDEIADDFVAELLNGIGDSGVRAGIIGEIGTSDPIHPDERKVLRAGALAQARTGAPISIHLTETAELGNEVLDILEDAGADPHRVILGHVDGREPNLSYLESLAQRGAYLELDYFGVPWTNADFRSRPGVDPAYPQPPSDQTRVRMITELVERGYIDRLLLSHDTATKAQLVRYGGHGYAHILEYVVPWLRTGVGLDTAQVDRLLADNPQRVLAWVTGASDLSGVGVR